MPAARNDFGFEASYAVEVNPEHPPAGIWPVPAFSVGDRGNDTLTLRFDPEGGRSWVASFALDSRRLHGVFACPGAGHALVLTGNDAFLVRVTEPGSFEQLPIHPPRSLQRVEGAMMMLIASFSDLACIDSGGLAWAARRIFTDELEVIEASSDRILLRGWAGPSEDSSEVELDPATGLGRS